MNLSLILQPIIDLLIANIYILLSGMLSFLALIWSAKKLLYMIEISDFAVGLQVRKDERRQKALRKSGKIRNSFLKTSQTKREATRRKKLYKLKLTCPLSCIR